MLYGGITQVLNQINEIYDIQVRSLPGMNPFITFKFKFNYVLC